MKKFCYLILLVFLFFVQPVFAQRVNFIQVTDVHLTKDNARCLKDFVDEVNQKYTALDFVVFTGDNIDKANQSDLDLFLKTIKNLKFKTYVTVGNHDLFQNKNMSGDYYMMRTRNILGSYHPAKTNYVFRQGNLVFIVMNGVKEIIPGPNGYYKEAELIWLDGQLTKYRDKKVVILQHFPLLETKSQGANLYKREEYLKVLNKHNNVIAVISGHYHYNREEEINEVYHIVTQKFSDNTYYKLISIDDEDGFIYTTLIDKSNISTD